MFTSEQRMSVAERSLTRMAKKKVPLIVAVVQPVAKRLARIEALLIEMRFEQDMQIKRLTVLREQFDHYLEGESAPRKRKKR